MKQEEQKSNKCMYCGNFDRYYTQGLRRFKEANAGSVRREKG